MSTAVEQNTATTSGGQQGSLVLHPNLARIAAAYQELTQAYADGRIDAHQATMFVRELVARDDEGTQWTINPRDGGWLRFTRNGELVPAAPPQLGVATLASWELSGAKSQDGAITYTPAAHPADVVAGSMRNGTHRAARKRRRVESISRPRWVYPAMVVGALLVSGFALLGAIDDGGAVPTPGQATIPAAIAVNGVSGNM